MSKGNVNLLPLDIANLISIVDTQWLFLHESEYFLYNSSDNFFSCILWSIIESEGSNSKVEEVELHTKGPHPMTTSWQTASFVIQ